MSLKRLFSFISALIYLLFSHSVIGEPLKNYKNIEKPPVGSNILTVEPDVSLSEITALGTVEPKTEWSQKGKANLIAAINSAFKDKGYSSIIVSSDEINSPENMQFIKLKEAINIAIRMNQSPITKLPTKKTFDWSLGEGASKLIPSNLAAENKPKYIMFIKCEGTYSSNARKAMMVGAALLRTYMPSGGQALEASIVDTTNGDILWYEIDNLGLNTDIRSEEGAANAINNLFKKLPF